MPDQSAPPIPVFGVPRNVRPVPQIKIPLWWHALDGIGWKERGEVCTKTQLEDAILQSAGQHLPNGLLPALDPGDVLILAEGEFWITAILIMRADYASPKNRGIVLVS